MPEAGNAYAGGYYRNSSVSGNWADYLGGVVPFIDLHLRTLARSGGRAVAGWSMGGYGAIHLVTLAGDMTRRSTHIRCIHPPMLRRMSFERWTL